MILLNHTVNNLKITLHKNPTSIIERGFYFPINTTPCFKMLTILKKKFLKKNLIMSIVNLIFVLLN